MLHILCIAISIFLSLLLPILALKYWYSRNNTRWRPAIIGALTFVVFALILEQIFHSLVLKIPAMSQNTVLYVLYGGLSAALFEESGRYVAFRYLLKKDQRRADAVTYGFGHGGIESILLAGLAALANFALAVLLFSTSVEELGNLMDPVTAQAIADTFAANPPYLFVIGGVERLFAVTFHVSLSVLVFKAVREKKIGFWILAIILHMLADCYAALYQVGVIENVFLIEGGVFLFAVLSAALARKVYTTLKVDYAPISEEEKGYLPDDYEI